MQVNFRVSGRIKAPVEEVFEAVADPAQLSRYFTTNLTLDGQNNSVARDIHDGHRPLVKAFGVETQLDLAGWSVTDRFRYADISGSFFANSASSSMYSMSANSVWLASASYRLRR